MITFHHRNGSVGATSLNQMGLDILSSQISNRRPVSERVDVAILFEHYARHHSEVLGPEPNLLFHELVLSSRRVAC
jgi:hypothetical protein